MKLKHVKKLLMDEIRKVAQSVEQYCNNPLKDFTRTRKLPIEKLMLGIIGMESGSITNELIDYYDISPDAPTASRAGVPIPISNRKGDQDQCGQV